MKHTSVFTPDLQIPPNHLFVSVIQIDNVPAPVGLLPPTETFLNLDFE